MMALTRTLLLTATIGSVITAPAMAQRFSSGPFRPVSSASSTEFPELPGSLRELHQSNSRPSYDSFAGEGSFRSESRFDLARDDRGLDRRSLPSAGADDLLRQPRQPRMNDGFGGDLPAGSMPAGRTDRLNPSRRLRDPFRQPDVAAPVNDRGLSNDDWSRQLPDGNNRLVPDPLMDGRDPFVPAPLPVGRGDSETETINNLISARYQNPVTVRAVRAMSANQALKLYDEVSQRIDERHLEPSSYDLRIRRGLRNLSIALDNSEFVNALGISTDSFRTDGFRNSLSSAAGSMRVSDFQDARNVVTSVMQQAQTVTGLTPSVVAFEFANASLDTLDKFSGLEPADPTGVPGAAVPVLTKSAALEDEIVGIGVEVKEDARGLLVVKALRGGPAAESGIESGDLIIAINGRSITGMKMANSVDLMKGSAGSTIRLRIFRNGRGERDFSMTRRKVRVWTVNDTRLLSGTDVGYLSLSRFSQGSTAELDQALSDLYKSGMKSLIIDLRGNPGGLLTTCVEISDRFLPCGTIVSTKGRLSSDNMLETASWNKTWNMPLVVLVDGDSASASEIFAAAVQDNQRGVVVGTRSYGKGSVQTHFPLNTISGNLRLTTALFYSPNGRPMAGSGVTPDVAVNDPDGAANGDLMLERAMEIARSQRLQEMAKAAGTCRTGTPVGARSSSLENLRDAVPAEMAIR